MSVLLIFQNCGKDMQRSPELDAFIDNQKAKNQKLSPSASGISAEDQARDLYRRLTGTTPSTSDSIFQEMVDHIKAGRRKQAAIAATQVPTFYTLVVRDFAGKMSTREGTSLAPMSDFVATVIGAVRDNVSATDLLTGNFYYRVKNVTGVNDDLVNAIVKTNDHYKQIEDNEVNILTALEREEGQKIMAPNSTTNTVVLDDAAGLLTTRAYLMAQTFAGTNRRVIANTFRTFLCTPIEGWASTTNPDSHIGRDIGRYPIAEYNSKCKGCHTGMDAMRPASAYYDFFMEDEPIKKGHIRYKFNYATDPDESDSTKTVAVPADQRLVPSKFRRGSSTFPMGYTVKNNSWVNYADDGLFGWNTPTSGEGMNELGQMIAYSDGFRYCMAKRVFAAVCKFELSYLDQKIVKRLADDFKHGGYNLKDLFVAASLRPECLGVE